MKNEMNEKASDLDAEKRGAIESTLFDQRNDSFNRFLETADKLAKYNFLVNGGGAIAVLAFIGSERGTYSAIWPLMCFIIGLIAAGVQIRALFIFFGILMNDASRRFLGFSTDKLTVREIKPPQDIGKWAGKIENWASWIAQGAFVAGVLVGACIVLVSV